MNLVGPPERAALIKTLLPMALLFLLLSAATAAEKVVLHTEWWPPGSEKQAEAVGTLSGEVASHAPNPGIKCVRENNSAFPSLVCRSSTRRA